MKLPRIKSRVYGVCPIKGCGAPVSETSTTKVCQKHMHVKPWCECAWCRGGWGNQRVKVKTRLELRAEGLL